MHERTGEIELLISGALLLGLFQVPGYLDEWFDLARVRLGPGAFTPALMVWIYVKLMVYTLIGSFSLHLVTRAYWVGLLGLDSAFPQGITWDRIRYGPLAKQVYQERLSSLPLLARRADDVASSIFSFAFWIVLVFVLSIAMVGGVGALALALNRTLLPGVPASTIIFAVLVPIGLLPVVAIGLDRVLEGRIDEDGRPARLIKRVVAFFYQAFGGVFFMPIQFTLFSNVPKKVIWPLYIGVFVVLFGVFYGNLLLGSGVFVLSPSAVMPTRPGLRSVDTRYYEDQRGTDLDNPSIQSDIIEGPYVRLTVPFVARRDVRRIAALCPDVQGPGREGLARSSPLDDPPDPALVGEALACVAKIWVVQLDGVPVSLDWDFRSSPGYGVTGFVAYLPTEGLEAGAHVLSLLAPPVPDEEDADEDPSTRRHFIRFRI